MTARRSKTVGIVVHSAEGGALCFLAACREGAALLGEHMHPEIVVSAIPMGLSMAGWQTGNYDEVAKHLADGVWRVADAGADFFICPDNTAHIVLERIAEQLPLPGLHIADVVCHEIRAKGWKKVGLLGTKWTMTGPVYERKLRENGMERLTPDEVTREHLNDAIFEELCNGVFLPETVHRFVRAIETLRDRGAECVILGCTEIPLIISSEISPLPILDSTRLLAKYAVREAVSGRRLGVENGWLALAEGIGDLLVSPSEGG